MTASVSINWLARKLGVPWTKDNRYGLRTEEPQSPKSRPCQSSWTRELRETTQPCRQDGASSPRYLGTTQKVVPTANPTSSRKMTKEGGMDCQSIYDHPVEDQSLATHVICQAATTERTNCTP